MSYYYTSPSGFSWSDVLDQLVGGSGSVPYARQQPPQRHYRPLPNYTRYYRPSSGDFYDTAYEETGEDSGEEPDFVPPFPQTGFYPFGSPPPWGYSRVRNEPKSSRQQEPSEEKETEEPISEKPEVLIPPEKQAPPERKPFRRTSSMKLHAAAPSPLPDQLQVSSPNIRVDSPFSPLVDIYDKSEEYLVVLSLPGAKTDSFFIDFHPSSHELVLKGNIENKYINETESDKYLKVSEQRFGAFERTIKFPVIPQINEDSINARYSNGLLEIKIPKVDGSEKARPKRRIEIETVEDEELTREAKGGWNV